ncbi:Rad52/Rad22 family DNA repair protein [Rhizobium hidalgonense]|uniref:Rad52/Rad22 family DNA repair protein n=1 Tax=Rhizobium hidalgonense TaxID=1538159 RepID=UPI002870E5FE|nr:Rad52/Rad22 family DNA repair protein [Rhizobium hidalgonense]MDR9813064.1 Rad52/Rad22 family DNA repair protein [Rhizobium hidalgonense]
MPTTEELKQLFAEFPRDAVSWRAQSMTRDGTKAMALAYIDARDVMDRLDDVCGSENWQDRYEFHGTRTICYLSIRVDGEWVTKADGAGDSDVEAEKGAISDALKRAAVKWGIGRYLYSIVTPWVPCETYESNGKKHWKSWSVDPWSLVRSPRPAPQKQPEAAPLPPSPAMDSLWQEMGAISSSRGLELFWKDNVKTILGFDEGNRRRFVDKKDALKAKFAPPPPEGDSFPGSDRDALNQPMAAG